MDETLPPLIEHWRLDDASTGKNRRSTGDITHIADYASRSIDVVVQLGYDGGKRGVRKVWVPGELRCMGRNVSVREIGG